MIGRRRTWAGAAQPASQRSATAWVVIVALGAMAVGCHHEQPRPHGASAGGRLTFRRGEIPAFGFGKSNTPQGQSVAINTATMCTPDSVPARIVSVTLKDPENLALVDWGVRPYPPDRTDIGYWNGKVLDDPTFSQDPVQARCGDGNLVELNVSARWFSGPAGPTRYGLTHGLEVHTTNGTLFVPMRIALCEAACPDEALAEVP